MRSSLVAGIDSSTQQTKLVVVDAHTGTLVRSSALPHPDGTEVDPNRWWDALEGVGAASSPGVKALSVAAQQHTTIFLDEQGDSIRPALLWNDVRARDAAVDLRRELGDEAWFSALGLLPAAAHPVSKLRWLVEHEPDNARRLHSVLLPHDWLTWRLLDQRRSPTTDRSDASATGYWSALDGLLHPAFITQAFGRSIETPRILRFDDLVGTTSNGIHVASGCGDNPATHMALDTEVGDIVISIGTSATVSMRATRPPKIRTPLIDTMADPRGGYIFITAMLNGARVLTSTAHLLGVGLERMSAMAMSAAPDAHGALLVPYLDGERNPDAAPNSGALVGLSRSSMTPTNIARAAVLGLACSIADAVDNLIAHHCAPKRVWLVGGASQSVAVRVTVANLIGRPVLAPDHHEHAAFGAARQAARLLLSADPGWNSLPRTEYEPDSTSWWTSDVRGRFRDAVATRFS